MAVCDDRPYFERVVASIVGEAQALHGSDGTCARLSVIDRFKGPGYAVASAEQLDFIRQVARCCGLVLDPVYTGKALFGLANLEARPARALFIHSGGLPGLLAQTLDFGSS
jgi:D-cysteine desulfhydrase